MDGDPIAKKICQHVLERATRRLISLGMDLLRYGAGEGDETSRERDGKKKSTTQKQKKETS